MYEDKKRFIEKSMDLQFSIYNQRKAMCNDIRGKEMNADGTSKSRESCIICHNGKELLLVNLSILVEIKFINHGLAGAG